MKIYLLLLMSVVIASIKTIGQQAPASDQIIYKATQKAIEENKKVFIIFHASWCVWCRKMDSCLNDPSVKPFFERNFELVHLTVMEAKNMKNMENPGAMELYKKYGGDSIQGIPYWLILSKEGNFLTDSRLSTGANTGCPATKEEIDHLVVVFKRTTSITPEEIRAVIARFRKNDE